MDIMELGAIGELVGGLAVLVTLVYLALQVRQNTRSVRLTVFQASNSRAAAWADGVAHNTECLHTYRIGMKKNEVSRQPAQMRTRGFASG